MKWITVLLVIFILNKIAKYLVLDYRNGFVYGGLIGKLQKLLNRLKIFT